MIKASYDLGNGKTKKVKLKIRSVKNGWWTESDDEASNSEDTSQPDNRISSDNDTSVDDNSD